MLTYKNRKEIRRIKEIKRMNKERVMREFRKIGQINMTKREVLVLLDRVKFFSG